MKRWLIIVLLSASAWAVSGCDGSGNCYVRSGAGGSGNGSDWNNAYTGFGTSAGQINPASMTRGVIYFVAAGSYGSPNFSTAASGTTVITVEAATVLSHGTGTGWSNSYAGQVILAADTTISTSYWDFTGQTQPAGCATSAFSRGGACGVTGYNLSFDNSTDSSTTGGAIQISGGTAGSPQTNITISYAEVQGVNNGTSDDGGIVAKCALNNFQLDHSYLHDVGVDLFQGQYTCSGQNYTGVGALFERDFFARNHRGDAAAHAQAIATGFQNLIVRYSWFHDIVSSGCITDPFPGVPDLQNWAVYGNTFSWDNSESAGVGNGLVGLFGENMNGWFYVVNNTIANINNAACPAGSCNSWAPYICGENGGCNSGGTPSPAIVENNLWWNAANASGYVIAYPPSTWTPTSDYNQGYCAIGGCPNITGDSGGFVTQGAHDLLSNTGNPFSNFDGSSNFNVTLAANTSPGTAVSGWASLPSGCTPSVNCMNVDANGVIRGANGTFDRGAYQLAASTSGSQLSIGTRLSIDVAIQ